MKISRRERRAQARQYEKHFNTLTRLLMNFYEFLEQQPKPSDEEVRATFLEYNKRWKDYCTKMQLNHYASSLFTKEVSEAWKHRYSQQKNDSIEK